MAIEHGDALDLRDLADVARNAIAELEEDYDNEEASSDLNTLVALANDVTMRQVTRDSVADDLNEHGNSYEPTLIAESHFEDYARELAEDIGAIDKNASWPLNRIDWEAAAEDLKADYTEVVFDGRTYFIRTA